MRTVIYNAVIINEERRFKGYVIVDGEFITAVGEGLPGEIDTIGATLVDAGGAYLLPGAIDTHVHFREPGMTRKGNIASESAAAVAGGVTSYLEMPNTNPPAVSVEAINAKKEIASRSSHANYGFFIGATADNLDEILRADFSAIPGVKLFMGSSTGNMLMDDSDALEALFRDFHGVIAVHAEDETIIRENKQKLVEQFGEEAVPLSMHSLMRSREACIAATTKAIDLARRHGSRLHVLHLSTAEEATLFAPGEIGTKRITAETCPHYLIFTAGDMAERGSRVKCNPAIKNESDRRELLRAVADGRIDTIATDHAPHCRADKKGSLLQAASGMPGVKFMLPLLLDLTLDNSIESITPERIVRLVSHNPALLYGIDRRGFIREGYYADLVLVDPATRKPHTITDADSMTTGCDWTPYAGMQQRHRVLITMVNGRIVFDGREVFPQIVSKELKFNQT